MSHIDIKNKYLLVTNNWKNSSIIHQNAGLKALEIKIFLGEIPQTPLAGGGHPLPHPPPLVATRLGWSPQDSYFFAKRSPGTPTLKSYREPWD